MYCPQMRANSSSSSFLRSAPHGRILRSSRERADVVGGREPFTDPYRRAGGK